MMIGLARRGYSSTGGAEAFLGRFSEALTVPGHQSRLYTTSDWPAEAWTAGERVVLPGRTPREFADALTARNPRSECDLFFSLERVWNCDGYRAGDGVHAAWLQRRTVIEPPWRSKLHRFNPKHRQLLALEFALFAGGGAKKIIVNSQMVAFEIREHYGVAPDRIRFDRHVEVGVAITHEICQRLHFSNDDTEQIEALVANHMRFADVVRMKSSTLKRFLRLPSFEEHMELHRIDCKASHGGLDLYNFVSEKLRTTPAEEIRPAPLLTGRDLIGLGYSPGPRFKEILAAVEDAQLEGRVQGREEALALVRREFPLEQ
jgi:hypothetical protein